MFNPWKNKNKLYSVDKYRGVHVFDEGNYHIPQDSLIFRTAASNPVPVWTYTPPLSPDWKLAYVNIELEFYNVTCLVYVPGHGMLDYCTSAVCGMLYLMHEQHVDASRAKIRCIISGRCFMLPNIESDWVEVNEYKPANKMTVQNIGNPFTNMVTLNSSLGSFNSYVDNTLITHYKEFWQVMVDLAGVEEDDCVTLSVNADASYSFCVYNRRC